MGKNAFDTQPEARAASGPDSTPPPPRVGLLSLLSVSSIGADIFISYRRHEAKAYALELRRQLENRSYRASSMNAAADQACKWRIIRGARRSRMFVIVGSSTISIRSTSPGSGAYREGHLGCSPDVDADSSINVAGALSEIESPAASDKFKNTPWFRSRG